MELLSRPCPICNSNKNVGVFSQKFDNLIELNNAGDVYIQKIVICKDCGFVFNNPCPSYAELDKHYTSWSNYETPQTEGKATKEMDNKWQRTFDFVKKSFPEKFKGKALEVGCATAFGLSVFKSNGWEVLGLDPSEKAVNLAKKLYGIEVIKALFDINLFKGKKFDLIIFSHVLEHIISPSELVNELIPILEPNGLVFIEVPNMLRPEVPMGYFTFEHLNYFTPGALTNLMGVSGYDLNRVELFGGSMEIQPFYPVISALYGPRKSGSAFKLKNDFEASNEAVQNYIKNSDQAADQINKKIDAVLKKYSSGKIALWAAGIHTSQLLSLTKLSDKNIALIFDNDPKKQGQDLCNVKVTGLDPENVKNKVDCIIISSRAFEKEIYEQIKFLETYGIEIVKIYSN